jgi:hypothetical protein
MARALRHVGATLRRHTRFDRLRDLLASQIEELREVP